MQLGLLCCFLCFPGLVCIDDRVQTASQLRHEQRLAAECRNTGFFCLLLNIRPVVSRENNDRHIIPYLLADPAGNLHPIHIRHQPINDIYAVIIPSHHCLTGTKHSFLTG